MTTDVINKLKYIRDYECSTNTEKEAIDEAINRICAYLFVDHDFITEKKAN